MNQESRHFFVQTAVGCARLTSRGLDPDDHVAEEPPSMVAVLTFE